MMGISLYGVEDIPIGYEKLQKRRNSELEQNSVFARRQDLAFVMYTDKDIAEVIRLSKYKIDSPRKLSLKKFSHKKSRFS